jgi:hypothetical protein
MNKSKALLKAELDEAMAFVATKARSVTASAKLTRDHAGAAHIAGVEEAFFYVPFNDVLDLRVALARYETAGRAYLEALAKEEDSARGVG